MIIAIIYEHDQYPSIASASSVELTRWNVRTCKLNQEEKCWQRSINAAFKTAKM